MADPVSDDETLRLLSGTQKCAILMLLLGEDEELPNPARDMQRDMPGTPKLQPPQIEATGVAGVVESAREAEVQLFTRTGCFLCHSYREKPAEMQTSVNSHYEDRKSTRLNSSHTDISRMPSSA